MERFTRFSLAISSLLCLFILTSVGPLPTTGHVSAAPGVGGSECVKTKTNDCKDNDPKDGGGNGGGGSVVQGSNTPADKAACAGLDQLGGVGCDGNAGESAVTGVANRVVTIISLIAGIIAIIMIIVSGVRFTTSGGDANKVSGAKSALVYALVGIAIAVLAQVLVHYVIGTVRQ